MSQWIKKWPVEPIHLAVVLVALYFLVHRFSLLSLVVLLFLLVRFGSSYQGRALRAAVPILLTFGAFFLFQRWLSHQEEASLPQKVSHLVLLPDTIRINGDSLSFRGKAQGQLYQVFYTLQSQEEKTFFQKETELLELDIEGEIEEPVGQRNFNGFDYRSYLETQGIYRIVRVHQIQRHSRIWSWNPFDALSSLRRKALVHIHQTFPQPMSHYMTGLLFGELDSDFDEMGQIYTSLGIIHLFALSGMQVGFFITQFRRFFLWLGLTKEQVDGLQYPLSFLYAAMTGFSVSVIRSLLQKLWGNQGIHGLDNLAVTLLTCFICLPHFLLTTGGGLSFGYAFLLTVFSAGEEHSYRGVLKESLILSIGILPLLLYYFATFQPLSIVLTFLLSFVFDVLLLPLLSLLFLLSPLYAVREVNGLFVVLEKGLTAVYQVYSRPLVFGKPSTLVLVFLLLLLAFLYDERSRKTRFILLVPLVFLLFTIKHPLTNEVTMVDIGQGDSIFMRDSRGRSLLIDTGGKVDFSPKEDWQRKSSSANAERTLIPYLYSRGVSTLDQVLITHADADHCKDLEVLSRFISIKTIYVSSGSLTVPDFVEMLRRINVPVKVVAVGDKFPIFDSFLEVLYPKETGDGGNNDSIILYGNLLHKKFLFTGDLEERELDLVRQYPNLSVDVLKAGHHGSKGSSYPEFLDHIQAKMVLISAGAKNRYHHPNQETLDRFEERGMTIYRTDEQGAIRFIGWDDWRIETVR